MTLSGKLARTTIMISLYFIIWICVMWTSVSNCFHLLTASVFSSRCCSPDWSEWCHGRGRCLWWWVSSERPHSAASLNKAVIPILMMGWREMWRCDDVRNTYLHTENRLEYTPRENTNDDKDIINCCVWLPEMSPSGPRSLSTQCWQSQHTCVVWAV